MGNLRLQLLFSHLLLVLLMVVVMVGGVISVAHLGRSIDRILKDNYKSVVAAQTMKDALERIDSSATLYLAGNAPKARAQYEANVPRFEEALRIEAGNITEKGEQDLSDAIGRQFPLYRADVARLLYAPTPMPTREAREYYLRRLEPAFVGIKQDAQRVLDLNQDAIVRADVRAKDEARRTSWIGIVVAMVAFVGAIAIALRMIGSALTPVLTLARQAEEIGAGHLNQRIELHRHDEIGTLAAAFNDMTEKLREARRLEEERLRMAERMSDAAIDNLYDPVIVTDAGGRIAHLNKAAEGLFGPAGQATGRPVPEVVSDARVIQAVEHAIRLERASAEENHAGLVSMKVGNARRTYRIRAAPMRDDDGAVMGAVAVLDDVTHMHEIDRLKTEFIGVASHELRTPVTSLLLSVDLLAEGAAGPLTAEQQEIVAAQKEDLQRLERMMRELLELTRLEAGVTPPRFEIVAPAELIQAAVSQTAAAAGAKGMRVAASAAADAVPVRADRAQVVRVLVNLLNNAIRHTPTDGSVSVSAEATPEGVRFAVTDTGVGIPREYLPRIFDRFVQVPGSTRGGAGLGLSIAQTIVKAHGGEITADSSPGQGSTFTFELPAADRGKD